MSDPKTAEKENCSFQFAFSCLGLSAFRLNFFWIVLQNCCWQAHQEKKATNPARCFYAETYLLHSGLGLTPRGDFLTYLITVLTEVISVGFDDGQRELWHLFYFHVWMSL